MANKYPANIGDVFKHLLLCSILEQSPPDRYFESHGGRSEYDLDGVNCGAGGIWDFLEAAGSGSALAASSYFRIEQPIVGARNKPGTYLGSIGLAHAMLRADCEIHVAEIVDASADALEDIFSTYGRPGSVHRRDGHDMVLEHAQPGDLVMLDPFDVQGVLEQSEHKMSSAATFAALANGGVAVILWYAVTERCPRLLWPQDLAEQLEGPVWRAEMRTTADAAGLIGCGFLGANLTPHAEATASWMAEQLSVAFAAAGVANRTRTSSPMAARGHVAWTPRGSECISAEDLRRRVAAVGFPLVISDADGLAYGRPAEAHEVTIFVDPCDPGQAPKLVIETGPGDRPLTLTPEGARGEHLFDQWGQPVTLGRQA
jgi:23S rRNA A2030 N6-methylase RlmJ